jgi:magnesium transporter
MAYLPEYGLYYYVMALFGELFLSDVIKKPVFDPKGEIIGRVRDVIVVKGDPLPEISAVIVQRKGRLYLINWASINIFNRRIISSFLYADVMQEYERQSEDLRAVRDILDKQIVDANGAKVVRVNDIKLEGYNGTAVLVAVDVGMRGILRRLGVENRSEDVLRFFNSELPFNLISWNYMQPLRPELQAITLTVPRQMLSELHPADLAELISQVSREEGAALVKDLDIETAAEAISEMQPEKQADIINSMETEKAADILEEMEPDEAADVLSDLPTEKAKEILEAIDKEEAEDIQELLGHEEDTAGGLMTNIFIAYPPDITVEEAIRRFRKDAEEIEPIYYIYITDIHEKLIGVISLRDLLLAVPGRKLSDIMITKVKTVSPETDDMVAAEIISKYNVMALPVVDGDNILLGVVMVDDVIDIILPPSAKRSRRKV